MINNEYLQQEYNEFLRYVKSTWGCLFENDWKEKVTIRKVIIYNHKNNFKVFVYLNDNSYYVFKNGEVVDVKYSGKPIKTEYCLNEDVITYMLLKGSFVEDLGLSDVPFHMFDYVDGIEVDTDLSKMLESEEEDYAYNMYCIEHDL